MDFVNGLLVDVKIDNKEVAEALERINSCILEIHKQLAILNKMGLLLVPYQNK